MHQQRKQNKQKHIHPRKQTNKQTSKQAIHTVKTKKQLANKSTIKQTYTDKPSKNKIKTKDKKRHHGHKFTINNKKKNINPTYGYILRDINIHEIKKNIQPSKLVLISMHIRNTARLYEVHPETRARSQIRNTSALKALECPTRAVVGSKSCGAYNHRRNTPRQPIVLTQSSTMATAKRYQNAILSPPHTSVSILPVI